MRALAPLGLALKDYLAGSGDAALVVHPEGCESEGLSVAHFFRSLQQLSELEMEALARCRGRVLDVGACAGAHALILQGRGHAVTAIDVLPEAVEVMRRRGVSDARLASWADPDILSGPSFETVLVLMNGAGVAGTVRGLDELLRQALALLVPAGRLLIDSTDLRPAGPEAAWASDDGRYPGELHYQLEYRGQRGDPFPHLFVDQDTFRELAHGAGLDFHVAHESPDGAYLAELNPRVDA